MKNLFTQLCILLAISTTMATASNIQSVPKNTKTLASITVTVTSTAGGLAAAITNGGSTLATITDLTVKGVVDQRDFATLNSMALLTKLNLTTANIVKYNDGVTNYPNNKIPDNAFLSNTKIVDITLPTSATATGTSSFQGCIALTTINLQNITDVGASCFMGCTSLANITLPTSITNIKESAFQSCTALTTISLPNIPKIKPSTFLGCTALTSVTIPSSVTVIGESSFQGCTALTTISLPNITEIKASTFIGCQSLKTIAIPSTVTTLGTNVFQDCNALATIVDKSTVPQTVGDKAFHNVDQTNCKLYVPVGAVPTYKSNVDWVTFSNIVEYTISGVVPMDYNLKISVENGKLNIVGNKTIKSVEIISFDGKTISREQFNDSSCSINTKGEKAVIAKIYYQDGSSQTTKIVESK